MKKGISQIKSGVIIGYINLLLGNIIPLIYTPIMLDIMGKSEYGLYTLAYSVVGYLTLLKFGLGGTIVRYVSKYRSLGDKEGEERVVGLFLKVYAVLSALVLTGGAIIYFNVNLFFKKGLTPDEIEKAKVLVILMAMNTAIAFPTSVFAAITTSHERFVYKKIIDTLSTVLAPCLNLVMLFMGFMSIGLTISSTILNVLTFFLYSVYCMRRLNVKPKFKKAPEGLLKEILSFSAFIFLGELVNMLYWATDKVMIGAFVSTAAVAVYNIGATFNTMMQSLTTSIGSFFAPRITKIVFTDNDDSKLNELFIRIGRIQYLILSIILSGFIVFGKQFIRVWAAGGTDAYNDSYAVALLTMIPVAVPIIQSVALQVIVAKRQHMFRAVVFLIVAVFNVIGTYFLLKTMGVIGAAVATCGAYILGPVIIMNWYYHKKSGLNVVRFWSNIIRMVPVALIMTAAGFFAADRLALDSYASLLPAIVIYAVVFVVLTYFMAMNKYEKDLFGKPVKMIFSKLKRRSDSE